MRNLVLLLAACSYDAPLVDDAQVPDNVIAGEVIALGAEAPAHTAVLLYAADDPPPPEGTGQPLTFTTVPASDFTKTGSNMLAASYAIPHVPDGTYLVTGLMDVDENFHPLSTALAGATCGDLQGAHVDDPDEPRPAPVEVAGGELLDHVTVLLAQQVAVERPAFALAEGRVIDREEPETQLIRLAATGISTELLELAPPDAETCPVGLPVLAHEEDGAPVPHPDLPPEEGLFDIWPRVYLEFLGVPHQDGQGGVTFVNELEAGERVVGQAVPHPKLLYQGDVQLETLTLLPSLDLVWIPGGRRLLPDGSEKTIEDPTDLPAGAWAITVVSPTGQTWTIPNDLAQEPSTDSDYESQTQGAFLVLH